MMIFPRSRKLKGSSLSLALDLVARKSVVILGVATLLSVKVGQLVDEGVEGTGWGWDWMRLGSREGRSAVV